METMKKEFEIQTKNLRSTLAQSESEKVTLKHDFEMQANDLKKIHEKQLSDLKSKLDKEIAARNEVEKSVKNKEIEMEAMKKEFEIQMKDLKSTLAQSESIKLKWRQ
eukprot:TRINITY_DN22479_c1_g1_i9.p1 TRINITY_DN22479_c1_g1~~TRINITY_DN22479_c1_g1_i9.p1  ORF type:complete len:119 (+),score=48.00 TRINITY_DN22479_c1_g1_i9:37-357(+)